MSRKSTSDIVKTEAQALAETLAAKLDWPGMEEIIKLGLAVIQHYHQSYDLDPEKCYEIATLAERWGWSDLQSFKERLEKSGVKLYEVGAQKTIFVQLKDIMEAPECLHQKRSKSTRSGRKAAVSTTTAGRI